MRVTKEEIIKWIKSRLLEAGHVSTWEVMERFNVSYTYAYSVLRFLSATSDEYVYYKNTLYKIKP